MSAASMLPPPSPRGRARSMTCQKAVVLEIRKSDTEVRMIDAVVICHVENFRVSFPDKREDKIVPRQVTMLMSPADSRGTEKVPFLSVV